jgi:AcrR family transcriptional regulator
MEREDILLAAAQIIRRKGFHAASMQDIADAVGLQKASLYHHVRSKQEILLALLDRALDLLIQDLEAIVGQDGPAPDKLRQAVRAYMLRLTQEIDLASVLLLEYRSLNPDQRARHNRRRDRYEELWRTILRQGAARGDFRTIDEFVGSAALLGIQNWSVTWYRRGGRLSPSELADQFADLMLYGLEPARRRAP